MFVGLAMMVGALLWARSIRRRGPGTPAGYRGPWLLGAGGLCVFLLYLWLVSSGVLGR